MVIALRPHSIRRLLELAGLMKGREMEIQSEDKLVETHSDHPVVGMDAELKRKWVEALRSGEYAQCEGSLHDPLADSFCCLGVLCVVAGANFERDYTEYDNDFKHHDMAALLNGWVVASSDGEELTKSFVRQIGLPDQSALISMNDGFLLSKPEDPTHVRKHSFAEIADYIEANIPESVQ